MWYSENKDATKPVHDHSRQVERPVVIYYGTADNNVHPNTDAAHPALQKRARA